FAQLRGGHHAVTGAALSASAGPGLNLSQRLTSLHDGGIVEQRAEFTVDAMARRGVALEGHIPVTRSQVGTGLEEDAIQLVPEELGGAVDTGSGDEDRRGDVVAAQD